jgi:general stress protein CsbA
VATLGIQFGWLAGLRVAVSDVFVAAAFLVLLTRHRSALLSALRSWTPVHTAAASILAALLWGTCVAFVRTGVITTESLLNKDLGWLIFGATVLVVRSVVVVSDDVVRLLRYVLSGGLVVEAVAVIWFTVAVVSGHQPDVLRFDGFLLNPNANGLFVSILLVLQIASTRDSRIFSAPRMVQFAGIAFLLVLLLATLSRSSWIAAILALALLGVTAMRRSPWPFVCALVLLAFSLGPLTAALAPVWSRLSAGQLPASERTFVPSATPPPDIAVLLNGVTPAPSPPPSSLPVRSPLPSRSPDYLSSAAELAAERYGASDRLALDILAVRLWLGSPATAFSGIGLGVYFQLTPFLFGIPVVIHSSYLWMPVEMGLPGIGALLVLGVVGYTICRSSSKWQDQGLVISIAGSLFLIAFWSVANEGIYQRALWLFFALGGTLAWRRVQALDRSHQD